MFSGFRKFGVGFWLASLACGNLELGVQAQAPGSVDVTFDPSGDGTSGRIIAMAVQPDGRVLIGGQFTNVHNVPRAYLARLNADGSLDASFDPGVGPNGQVRAIAVQSDHKILIGGQFSTFQGVARQAISRIHPNGQIDVSFIPDAQISVNDVNEILFQNDGKIVILDSRAVVRLDPDGSLDPTFTRFGNTLLLSESLRAVASQADNKLVVGGSFLLRLNSNGTVDRSFVPSFEPFTRFLRVQDVLVQPDGKIVVAGTFSHVDGIAAKFITRLDPNGRLDRSFNADVPVAYSEFAAPVTRLALELDGRLLLTILTGTVRAVARLNPDGTSDVLYAPRPVFDNLTNAVGQITEINAMVLQADGNLLVAGLFKRGGALLRTNIARVAGGLVSGPPVIQQDISNRPTALAEGQPLSLVAGVASSSVPLFYQWQLNGLNLVTNLSPILSVNSVSGGHAGNYRLIVSNAFGSVTSSVAPITVTVLPTLPGDIDTRFNLLSGPDRPVNALALQLDGRIVIGGFFLTVNGIRRNGLARLNQDGSLDASFDPPYAVTCCDFRTSYWITAAALDEKQRILAVAFVFGNNGFSVAAYVARFLPEGTLDSTFAAVRLGLSIFPSPATSYHYLLPQPDGKILVAGTFSRIAGSTNHSSIARLFPDGSLDHAFNPKIGGGFVFTMTQQNDGNLLAGGSFQTVNGVSRRGIARLLPDGTLDQSFDPGLSISGRGGADADFGGLSRVHSLTIQTDGKIVIGGSFTNVDGMARTNVARLASDGRVDQSFGGTPAIGLVTALAVQSDGKILAGTTFPEPRAAMIRLNPNGALDTTFQIRPLTGGESESRIDFMKLQPDGKVLGAGNFSTVGGKTRPHVVRLHNNPELFGFRRTSNRFETSSGTLSGRVHVLERMNSLSDTAWMPVISVTGDGTSKLLIDTNATGTAAFYRVRVE